MLFAVYVVKVMASLVSVKCYQKLTGYDNRKIHQQKMLNTTTHFTFLTKISIRILSQFPKRCPNSTHTCSQMMRATQA